MDLFPNHNEYNDFVNYIYKSDSARIGAKKSYEVMELNFNSPKEFLSDINNKNIISNAIGGYGDSFNILVIFLSFKCKIKPLFNVQSIVINQQREIIEYFNLVPEKFWSAIDEKVVGLDRRKRTFLVQLIKALMYLEKENIKDISYENLLILRSEDFFTGKSKTESFPTLLQAVLAIANKESLPRRLPKTTDDNKNYGTEVEKIKGLIQKYLNTKYINKGYLEKSPLSSIRSFFNWLHKTYDNIETINDISKEQWVSYKKYIETKEEIKPRTKQMRIDLVVMFFDWLNVSGEIKEPIVETRERYTRKIKCTPRMFGDREIYKKILKAIIEFIPNNEREELVRKYLLIASATGLRGSEVLWLGPGCLVNYDGESAEVLLQIKEKLGIKHKTTSILKWGIEPLQELEERFSETRNKVKFYNDRTKEHFYSLFQDYDDRMLDKSFIYSVFNKIMIEANVQDEKGNLIDMSQVKIHGFRHQKFNDIYYVSNGSLSAVKVDSGHITLKMTKTYTQQNAKEKQIEALELINKGQVVGKGTQIIKALIKTPYSAQRYLDIVKKMNISILNNDLVEKKLRKNLGFGFCAGKSCRTKGACERCDFFYTCKTYMSELKDRYSKNFALLITSVEEKAEDEMLRTINKELAIDLKYQEKWLYELGLTSEDIIELRTMGLKEG